MPAVPSPMSKFPAVVRTRLAPKLATEIWALMVLFDVGPTTEPTSCQVWTRNGPMTAAAPAPATASHLTIWRKETIRVDPRCHR